MDLLDPAAFAYRGSGARVPFLLEGRQPHASATLAVPGGDDLEGDMIVDTGAADNVNLNTPFVRAHHLLQRARRTPPGAPSTLPGMEKEFFAQTSVRGRIDAITIGAVTLKDVPVNLMMSHSGGYASEGFSGTIGEGVLHRFRSTWDYARSTLWLEPDTAFASPFPARRSFGLSLVADGPDLREFEVSAVRPGSPADSAGFRAGDLVTAMDGRPAADLRLVELRTALGAEGSRHTLALKRGDGAPRTLAVTVRLVTVEDP